MPCVPYRVCVWCKQQVWGCRARAGGQLCGWSGFVCRSSSCGWRLAGVCQGQGAEEVRRPAGQQAGQSVDGLRELCGKKVTGGSWGGAAAVAAGYRGRGGARSLCGSPQLWGCIAWDRHSSHSSGGLGWGVWRWWRLQDGGCMQVVIGGGACMPSHPPLSIRQCSLCLCGGLHALRRIACRLLHRDAGRVRCPAMTAVGPASEFRSSFGRAGSC